MRREHNVLLTMGSVMLITSGAAMAGPPPGMTYGDFSVSGGNITMGTCPSGVTCGTAITGDGFLQRSLVVSGTTYYQTIVLPSGGVTATTGAISTLAFVDENFVQQGGTSGIADQQTLQSGGTTSDPTTFSASTTINSGWAQGAGDVISLSQTVDDPGTGANDAFNVGFSLTGDGTTATSLNVTESVGLGGTNPNPDRQKFDLRQLTATSASSETLSSSANNNGNGGTVTWVAGDIIQAVWMGQAVTATGTDQQSSGFLGYAVIPAGSTTATQSISYTDQTTTGPSFGAPNDYDTVTFGTAPTF